MSEQALRRQAERLLAVAMEAREQGELALADQLEARAIHCFEQASGMREDSEPATPPPAAAAHQEPQQQQLQQQQQRQGDDESA